MKKLDPKTTRCELKYKIFNHDLFKFYSWLYKNSTFTNTYPNRVVSSLYFDTQNFDFAISNMSGESRRIKVRARWYGSNTKIICNDFLQKNIHFNIELKRKDNNLSDKHILDQIYLRNSSEHLQRISFIEKSLNNNVNLRSYGLNDYLSAAVFVSYEREYYEIIGNSTVRLTIDKNINYSTKDSNSNDGKLSHDFSIVELKFNPVQREKVADMMSSFPFRQMRFSKYLSAISKIKLISY